MPQESWRKTTTMHRMPKSFKITTQTFRDCENNSQNILRGGRMASAAAHTKANLALTSTAVSQHERSGTAITSVAQTRYQGRRSRSGGAVIEVEGNENLKKQKIVAIRLFLFSNNVALKNTNRKPFWIFCVREQRQ